MRMGVSRTSALTSASRKALGLLWIRDRGAELGDAALFSVLGCVRGRNTSRSVLLSILQTARYISKNEKFRTFQLSRFRIGTARLALPVQRLRAHTELATNSEGGDADRMGERRLRG